MYMHRYTHLHACTMYILYMHMDMYMYMYTVCVHVELFAHIFIRAHVYTREEKVQRSNLFDLLPPLFLSVVLLHESLILLIHLHQSCKVVLVRIGLN